MAIALQLHNNKYLHNGKIKITTIVKLALWPYITQKHKNKNRKNLRSMQCIHHMNKNKIIHPMNKKLKYSLHE